MFFRHATAALALAGLIASAAPSFAMTGAGCPDLPEYYRALGTVENGEGSCGMTMAEANRILAQHQKAEAPADQPAPRKHRKHHRTTAPHL